MLYDSGPFKKYAYYLHILDGKIAEMYTAISLCRKNMASDSNEGITSFQVPYFIRVFALNGKDLVK